MSRRSQAVAGLIRNTRILLRAFRDQAGADLVEWGLVFSLLALGGTAAVGTIAGGVGTAYNSVVAKFAVANGSGNLSGSSYSGNRGTHNATNTASGNTHGRKAGKGGG